MVWPFLFPGSNWYSDKSNLIWFCYIIVVELWAQAYSFPLTRAVFILRAQVFLNLHPSASKLILYQVTYFEAHPINGFSQRSIVSNSICQFFVLNEPDCVAVRAGTKILAFLSLTSQSGTPVVVSITSWKDSVRNNFNFMVNSSTTMH